MENSFHGKLNVVVNPLGQVYSYNQHNMSLLKDADSQSAFSHPGQISLSNSSLLGFSERSDVDNYEKTPVDQNCNNDTIDSPYMQRRLTINNPSDGADVPLLNSFVSIVLSFELITLCV